MCCKEWIQFSREKTAQPNEYYSSLEESSVAKYEECHFCCRVEGSESLGDWIRKDVFFFFFLKNTPTEPRAFHTAGKQSTTKLYPKTSFLLLILRMNYTKRLRIALNFLISPCSLHRLHLVHLSPWTWHLGSLIARITDLYHQVRLVRQPVFGSYVVLIPVPRGAECSWHLLNNFYTIIAF